MSVNREETQPRIIGPDDAISTGKLIVLGVQHTFTMFGATILVPILTGMDISVALFMAGVGTLLFHLISQGKVPVFLGSSFAFIPPVIAVTEMMGDQAYAQGGVVVSGFVYLIMALLVYLFGYQKVVSFFPPVVTGPIIIIIGLNLAGTAVGMAEENWWLALVSFLIVGFVSIFTRGFLRMLPVLCGLLGGYLVAALTGHVSFAPIVEAPWIGIPSFTLAKFDISAISIIAPVAVATMVEHIGDVVAVGATVNRDFMKSPGIHRTLLGDAVASIVSAMFGGPANTTYSENTGVLALTGVHKPTVMRVAACFAILLGIIPKLGAFIQTIPTPIVGGISIVLFGMIASVGVRTVVENRLDFSQARNMIISAVVLVLGIGQANIQFSEKFALGGLALAAIVGIILNKVLPAVKSEEA